MKQALYPVFEQCLKCQKCMHSCRFEAIDLLKNVVTINLDCVGCGACVKACDHNGFQVISAPLEENGKDKILLLPTVFFSQFQNREELQRALTQLKGLGFSHIVDVQESEALYAKLRLDYLSSTPLRPIINNHCPVINELIHTRYQTLQPQLLPFMPISEFVAKAVVAKNQALGIKRESYEIINACECIAKLAYAKQPLGNAYEVDKAIALSGLYQLLVLQEPQPVALPVMLTQAIQDQVPPTYHEPQAGIHCIGVDGIDKVIEVLDLCEFDQLEGIDFVTLSSCNNHCVGGNLLWRNSYQALLSMRAMESVLAPPPQGDLRDVLQPWVEPSLQTISDLRNRLSEIEAIDQIHQQLPMLDCKACGLPSCWKMAQRIVKGKATLKDCKILGEGYDTGKLD